MHESLIIRKSKRFWQTMSFTNYCVYNHAVTDVFVYWIQTVFVGLVQFIHRIEKNEIDEIEHTHHNK